MFRCDGDVIESLVFWGFWDLNEAVKEKSKDSALKADMIQALKNCSAFPGHAARLHPVTVSRPPPCHFRKESQGATTV